MKQNYQKLLERTLAAIPAGTRPTLLLHSCCAPCSSYVLEYLSEYFDIIVDYYNPNIAPATCSTTQVSLARPKAFWQRLSVRCSSIQDLIFPCWPR